MKGRVIELNGIYQFTDFDFNIQLFFNFSYKGLMQSFAKLYLPAREFPPPLKVTIAPSSGQYFSCIFKTITNNCSYYFYCFHSLILC